MIINGDGSVTIASFRRSDCSHELAWSEGQLVATWYHSRVIK